MRVSLRPHLGARTGSGNQRCSISVSMLTMPFCGVTSAKSRLGVWNRSPLALRMSEALREAEARHEQEVSDHIGRLPVAGGTGERAAGELSTIGRNAITLLSRDSQRMAAPSA